MKQVFSQELKGQLQHKLRQAKTWILTATVAAAVGLGMLTAIGEFAAWKMIIAAGCSFCVFYLDYWLLEKRILPLQRTISLLERESAKEGTQLSGTYLGCSETLNYRDGIFMRRLRFDCGVRLRNEMVMTEVNVPACIGCIPFEAGEQVTLQVSQNILTGYTCRRENDGLKIDLKRAGYSISLGVCMLALLVSILAWNGIYEYSHKLPREAQIQVAVCTIERANGNVDGLEKNLTTYGIRQVSFSYMESTDVEQAAQYLATYAVMDADLMMMSEFLFEEALFADGYALSQADRVILEEKAGFELRYTEGAQGDFCGIILYDPEDPLYSAQFPLLEQWLKVDGTDPYVMVINLLSEQNEDGAAVAAAAEIIERLTGRTDS